MSSAKQSNTERLKLLDKYNMCHKCEKAKCAPGKKYCFDCLDKIRELDRKAYDPEKAKKYQVRRRELYRQHIADGICVRCSKPATHGIYCLECSIKVKKHNIKTAERRKQERHDRGLIPAYRIENGLCFYCGEPVDTDTKICSKCTQKRREDSLRADKSLLRMYNKLLFAKRS